MRSFRKMFIVLLSMAFAHASLVWADTIYIDADAEPGGNGRSWRTAFDDLQDALAAAQAGDEIWVAEGTYTPTRPNGKRKATFQLISGVGIYGGFVGKEQRREERDPQANVTILSGDLNGDDGPNFENNDENSYHVTTGSGTDKTAILDGFTVTAGNANEGRPWEHLSGGGMYNKKGSPTLGNCTFARNWAFFEGGGMFNLRSTPTITNCTFVRNHCPRTGGGMSSNSGKPRLTNCMFTNNSSGSGAGMYNAGSSPILTNCTFSENSARAFGGAMYNLKSPARLTNCAFRRNTGEFGGAIANQKVSRPTLINCVIIENSSTRRGGGMYNGGSSTPTLINCTFAGNSTDDVGGGISTGRERATVRLDSCILWGNRDKNGMGESAQLHVGGDSPAVNFSCVQGWTGKMGGEGNIGDDPQFVDPESGNFRLAAGSPSIDAANSGAVPDGVETDLDGHQRFLDDPDTENTGRGPGCPVDMGAYEFQDGDCHCTGKEKLKAKCRGGKGNNKIKATLKKAEPQATVTFRLDGNPDTDIRKTVSNSGKAKAKFTRVPDGEHTVEIVECGARKNTQCP